MLSGDIKIKYKTGTIVTKSDVVDIKEGICNTLAIAYNNGQVELLNKDVFHSITIIPIKEEK